MTTLVQEFLEDQAARLPGKTALVCGDRRYTYSQLDEMCNRFANGLREQGVKRGDRVAIYMNNSVETVVAMLGALKAGAVFVVVNRMTKAFKLLFILNNCQASALILDARALTQGIGEQVVPSVGTLRSVIVCGNKGRPLPVEDPQYMDFATVQTKYPATRPGCECIDLDLACLIYTSGTTGESKGVMSDHSNVVFVTQSIAKYLKHTENDIVLSVLPLSFSYGLYQLTVTFSTGGTLVLEESFAFPDMVLERMALEKVTGFAAVPTIYAMLMAMDLSKLDLSSLRYLTNAAAGLPPEHVKRVRQAFPKVDLYLMHGLTEVARTMFLPPDQVDARPGASGIAIPGTELWIEDEQGKRLGAGEVGELVVRGRNVMRGYWLAPEMTEGRFRPGLIPGERICRSGDLFRMDDEGYFHFVSRADDIIKSRGEKVAPKEVENVLYAITGVTEAAVIGVPDPVMGQVVKAFVVAPGIELNEGMVIAHCKSRLEEYMVPRKVEFRESLPKTATGKIRKVELR